MVGRHGGFEIISTEVVVRTVIIGKLTKRTLVLHCNALPASFLFVLKHGLGGELLEDL